MRLIAKITLLTCLAHSNVSFALECTGKNPFAWNAVRPADEWFSRYYSHERGEWQEAISITRTEFAQIGKSMEFTPVGLFRFKLYPNHWPEQLGSNFAIELDSRDIGIGGHSLRLMGGDLDKITLGCSQTREALQCRNDMGLNLLYSPESKEGYFTFMANPEQYKLANEDREIFEPGSDIYNRNREVKKEYLNTPPKLLIEHFRCE